MSVCDVGSGGVSSPVGCGVGFGVVIVWVFCYACWCVCWYCKRPVLFWLLLLLLV